MALAEKTSTEALPPFRLGLKDHFYTAFQILTGILVAVDVPMAMRRVAGRTLRRLIRR